MQYMQVQTFIDKAILVIVTYPPNTNIFSRIFNKIYNMVSGNTLPSLYLIPLLAMSESQLEYLKSIHHRTVNYSLSQSNDGYIDLTKYKVTDNTPIEEFHIVKIVSFNDSVVVDNSVAIPKDIPTTLENR